MPIMPILIFMLIIIYILIFIKMYVDYGFIVSFLIPCIIYIVFISIIKTKRIKCKEEKNEPND